MGRGKRINKANRVSSDSSLCNKTPEEINNLKHKVVVHWHILNFENDSPPTPFQWDQSKPPCSATMVRKLCGSWMNFEQEAKNQMKLHPKNTNN